MYQFTANQAIPRLMDLFWQTKTEKQLIHQTARWNYVFSSAICYDVIQVVTKVTNYFWLQIYRISSVLSIAVIVNVIKIINLH